MQSDPADFDSPVSAQVWDAKYRLRHGDAVIDRSVADSWRRIAYALAAVEPRERERWEERFRSALDNFAFLPGGRIQAGAGAGREVTLFNCFVMGPIDDSLDGIFDALRQGAITMQQGGGIGYDFSTLRPRGAPAGRSGAIASGPVSFMRVWDAMCATILSTGARRGAMMAALRCDHPDIEEFVEAKRDPAALRHFNLSVLASDAFMQAVRRNERWPLVFPLAAGEAADGETVERTWPGMPGAQRLRVLRRVGAAELWERIMRATYDCAEPGVLFIDRIERANNTGYCERISATNPCGEIPLPAWGACNLGSINLTRFVHDPFAPRARLDLTAIAGAARIATRMLDNVYEASRFPLAQQAEVARSTRRIGLGLTGLGDALAMLGLPYDSEAARALARQVMRTVCEAAYRASVELAREKGPFPKFAADGYLRSEFTRALPADLLNRIRRYGIRNSHLTAIAPAGTISLLAGNVSSGLEPIYRLEYSRRIALADGGVTPCRVSDYAYRLFRRLHGDASLPAALVTARHVSPSAQIAMQEAMQHWVDSAISKTITVPADFAYERFRSIYDEAYARGLKGCTTYRPNPVTGAVLDGDDEALAAAPERHCCSIEREAD